MHIALTVFSLFCAVIATWMTFNCVTEAGRAADDRRKVEEAIAKLRAERDRVTVAERELDALRRELRKLTGKFYASQRERDEEDYERTLEATGQPPADRYEAAPFCENFGSAQLLGPHSEAAKCECRYCLEMRLRRSKTRQELVPATVQGQAAAAKLNAGKP